MLVAVGFPFFPLHFIIIVNIIIMTVIIIIIIFVVVIALLILLLMLKSFSLFQLLLEFFSRAVYC